MAKKGEARERIDLVCTECDSMNYRKSKNKKNTPDRLELKKYCNTCRKQTVHKEKK